MDYERPDHEARKELWKASKGKPFLYVFSVLLVGFAAGECGHLRDTYGNRPGWGFLKWSGLTWFLVFVAFAAAVNVLAVVFQSLKQSFRARNRRR